MIAIRTSFRSHARLAVAAIALAVPIGAAQAKVLRTERVSAPSVRVLDGESLVLRTRTGRQLPVKIAGVSCPKRGRPGWFEATITTQSLTVGAREISCRLSPTPVYGRLVGRCRAGGVDIGHELLALGLCRPCADLRLEGYDRFVALNGSPTRQSWPGSCR